MLSRGNFDMGNSGGIFVAPTKRPLQGTTAHSEATAYLSLSNCPDYELQGISMRAFRQGG